MAGIKRSWLEKAQRDLTSIAERHAGNFQNADVDWRQVRDQLLRFDSALENGDGHTFNEALGMLTNRLGPPTPLRGHIGPVAEVRSQPMPDQVLELLNKTVDKLNFELNPSLDSGHKDDVNDQTALDPSAGEK